MKQFCPKSCPSAKEPFAGFYYRQYKAGEKFFIEPGDVHHLVFVTSGTLLVSSEERRSFPVTANNFFFCYNCGHYEIEPQSDIEVIIAYFSRPGAACDVASLLQYTKDQGNFEYQFTSYGVNEQLSEFLNLISRYLDDGIPCAHMHQSAIEMLFVVFRFYYDVEDLAQLFFNLFDHTVSFRTMVEGNRVKAKNLNHLAELCGYDINTFNVVFRRHYPGYTPGVWMQIQRKDEVLADLTETDAPIYYISKKYGFSSSSHLGEYCKKYLGDTPTKIRAKYKKK